MSLAVNVGAAVLAMADHVNVFRPLVAAYDPHGRWLESPDAAVVIKASIQPMSSRDVQHMPEGLRLKSWVVGYTTYQIQDLDQATGRKPDVVEWRGRKYQIERVEDWADYGYYKFSAVEVGT